MIKLDIALAIFCGVSILFHILSVGLAWRHRRNPVETPRRNLGTDAEAVSVLRPVRGIDEHDELTLRSSFFLDHPNYELIFCCADAADPAVALINRLIVEHPHVQAQLLIGDDCSTANPKLNNLIKGWQAARHPWIILADCNVLMPTDYIQRLLGSWRADTGLVCSPPVGCMPTGLWAEVECAFLNTYQARWQYAADSIGLGFAQGKSMLWRRADLNFSIVLRIHEIIQGYGGAYISDQ